jgi:hypothetical protein
MNTGISRNGVLVLSVILLVLVAVSMFAYEDKSVHVDKVSNSIKDVINSADEGVHEFREEIKDEIDDNTRDSK